MELCSFKFWWIQNLMALAVFTTIPFTLCIGVAPTHPECAEAHSGIEDYALLEVDCSGKEPFVKASLNSIDYAIVNVKAVCTWNQTESEPGKITGTSLALTQSTSTTVKNVPSGAECTFTGCYEVADIYVGGKYLFEPKSCVYNRDECKLGEDDCHQNANCINVIDGFECHCHSLFFGDGKNCTEMTNECEQGTDMCDTNATCNDTESSYNCSCNVGYTGTGFSCSDIDECSEGTDGCEYYCTNTIGSFECYCRNGYALEEDRKGCKDIDECQDNPCNRNAICTNVDGGYNCACNDGYEGDGFNCTDTDECALGKDMCHTNATCLNTKGSYECYCKVGFIGTGLFCADIDECSEGTDGCEHNCSNTIGSYECYCRDGYTALEEDRKSCRDIDECMENPCNTSAICTNINGGYYCSCHDGYEGDGFNCTDTDECKEGTDGCEHDCTNTIGSFECNCRNGYSLEENGKNCTGIPAFSFKWFSLLVLVPSGLVYTVAIVLIARRCTRKKIFYPGSIDTTCMLVDPKTIAHNVSTISLNSELDELNLCLKSDDCHSQLQLEDGRTEHPISQPALEIQLLSSYLKSFSSDKDEPSCGEHVGRSLPNIQDSIMVAEAEKGNLKLTKIQSDAESDPHSVTAKHMSEVSLSIGADCALAWCVEDAASNTSGSSLTTSDMGINTSLEPTHLSGSQTQPQYFQTCYIPSGQPTATVTDTTSLAYFTELDTSVTDAEVQIDLVDSVMYDRHEGKISEEEEEKEQQDINLKHAYSTTECSKSLGEILEESGHYIPVDLTQHSFVADSTGLSGYVSDAMEHTESLDTAMVDQPDSKLDKTEEEKKQQNMNFDFGDASSSLEFPITQISGDSGSLDSEYEKCDHYFKVDLTQHGPCTDATVHTLCVDPVTCDRPDKIGEEEKKREKQDVNFELNSTSKLPRQLSSGCEYLEEECDNYVEVDFPYSFRY